MLALVMITSAGCTSPDTHTQGDTVAYYNRAVAELAKGDLEGAIADYTKAIELEPNNFRAYDNRGVLKQAKGDMDGAIADYSKAIELKPDLANAFYNRGNAKVTKGDLDGGIADCTKAIELKPDLANAFYCRSHAKQAKGDWDGAIADFTKAIGLKPEYSFLIADCSQFIKSYPEDKRTEQAQQKIDEIAAALQNVPKLARDEGIPLASGFGVNLSGVAIFGGKIDLKTGGSGILSPYKPGESENLNKYSQGLVKGPLSAYKAPGEPPDANTLEKRSGTVSQITAGMTQSQTVTLLGNCEDMFEWADGADYQKVCFYDLKDGKTAILWFEKNDTLTLLHIAASAK
jgi:Tfp pilus assembly protein PilF